MSTLYFSPSVAEPCVNITFMMYYFRVNPLNAKVNPIRHLLALLGAHHILHVSRIKVKVRTVHMLLTAERVWLVWLTSPWWNAWQGVPHRGGPVSLQCRRHASPGVGDCYRHHLSAPRTSPLHGCWDIWRSETEKVRHVLHTTLL